ncbi:telomere length regulation protein-domain-containing protein [Schizophyllum amplum]|uniref:Telomere length regulation protein-domain-containing protein n=1 Tax=Schizophyllum amplum TaxID=97359 RepID=A0A550CAT6_9AGAR|nr:telomere length regulation protein-domain-containing protein [Auriculariopsis ampla]
MTDYGDSPVREILNQLKAPISDAETLLALLAAPLDSIGLLPPPLRQHNTNPLASGTFSIPRHGPSVQSALIQHVVPTWDTTVEEKQAMPLVTQNRPNALSTILSLPLTDFSIKMLARIAIEYPLDRMHTAIFANKSFTSKEQCAWEDYIRDLCAVPGKVANRTRMPPPALEYEPYISHLCTRYECLVSALPPRGALPSLAYVLTKLANVGAFPPAPPAARSQPSFWRSTLPVMRRKLGNGDYARTVSELVAAIPSTTTTQIVLVSLFAALDVNGKGTDGTSQRRALIKQEALVLAGILGYASKDSQIRDLAFGIMLGREWKETHARIFVCWTASSSWDGTNIEGLERLLTNVLDLWSTADHVKHSLLSRHHYITSLLLLTASYFPPSHPTVTRLAVSPAFVSGVSVYIGHMDTGVRQCGMLVAETVARYASKTLDFGDWDGSDRSSVWCRELRALIGARDIDAELNVLEPQPEATTSSPSIPLDNTHVEELVTPSAAAALKEEPISLISSGYDSDDSLEGYASPASSRSPSPTPSDLAEIERDPTLALGAQQIEAQEEFRRLEVALACAEELIRKKRHYGTELEENADNLVYALASLQDNYDLEGFEEKRQGALTALAACSSRKAAPALSEALFQNQYSAVQRYAILNALALGARDLAGLSVPPSAVPAARTAFPSKMLPPALHQRYLADSQAAGPLPHLLEGITRNALDKNRPPLKMPSPLSLANGAFACALNRRSPKSAHRLRQRHPRKTFTEVAAECFIMPLINRFWVYFRDERSREERTAHRAAHQRYRGAGAGLVLGALVLSRFLGALAVLVHAAQNAPEWLAVVAPEALELALTLGARPVSVAELNAGGQDDEENGKQAAVLTAALELAIVILDGCLELDGGQSMGLEHTALLLGVGEWAGAIFSQLEKGALVEGGGGEHEVRLRRAAAGVVLKVDEMTAKWRRSMVDVQ